MKITIDTKEDSSEEIKKIISFLHTIVGKEAVSNSNIFENPEVSKENVLGNIFNLNEEEPGEPKEPLEPLEIDKEPEERKKPVTFEESGIQIIY